MFPVVVVIVIVIVVVAESVLTLTKSLLADPCDPPHLSWNWILLVDLLEKRYSLLVAAVAAVVSSLYRMDDDDDDVWDESLL